MLWQNQGKNKAVTFSYDDGMVYDVRLIELFNKYGLKSTFNLSSEWLSDKKEGTFIGRYPKICRDDVKSIYDGHEVAAHTLNHVHLTECADIEVIRQVDNDRQRLSALVGYEVVGMAYPYGDFDDRVVELIRKQTGIRYSRTCRTTKSFEPQSDLLRFDPTVFHLRFDKMMSLAREFIETKFETPQIFYIFGHSYELGEDPNCWKQLEAFFEMISKRDDIFYGTNREVFL
jgi:peptidoglycan/xylan/chitin deacetylase (PgdA/CDA1 family)